MKVDKRKHLTTKLSYIAGFIDGEGCIRIKKSNQSGGSYYLTLHVTNSDKKPLELIRSIFGGKIYYQEKSKNKHIYQYYITCSEANDLLKTIVGYLIGKNKQALLAIKFHENKDTMTTAKKHKLYNDMANMKKENYENPELLQ